MVVARVSEFSRGFGVDGPRQGGSRIETTLHSVIPDRTPGSRSARRGPSACPARIQRAREFAAACVTFVRYLEPLGLYLRRSPGRRGGRLIVARLHTDIRFVNASESEVLASLGRAMNNVPWGNELQAASQLSARLLVVSLSDNRRKWNLTVAPLDVAKGRSVLVCRRILHAQVTARGLFALLWQDAKVARLFAEAIARACDAAIASQTGSSSTERSLPTWPTEYW